MSKSEEQIVLEINKFVEASQDNRIDFRVFPRDQVNDLLKTDHPSRLLYAMRHSLDEIKNGNLRTCFICERKPRLKHIAACALVTTIKSDTIVFSPVCEICFSNSDFREKALVILERDFGFNPETVRDDEDSIH